MTAFLRDLKTASLLTLLLALLLGGAYPLAVWAGAQLCFPRQANGSLIRDADGTVRGSTRLAQAFPGPAYFHPRPSAAGAGYDAANSGGSNLGPTSRALADRIASAVTAFRVENHLPPSAAVPADAVTASASGLDPHISPANAALQAARVAQARGLPLARIRAMIAAATEGPDLGCLGDPGVNVIRLNLSLDASPMLP
ncbi:MAG: K(+)-transporting ATPase subunit C [Verrucomicrobia bacterium]|nr:K(+)-transporting ATPase subunit C [Verrucomicrobiota bacterium]